MLLVFGLVCQSVTMASEDPEHWTYAGELGPEHWADLEIGSACSGARQSPVNIIRTDTLPNTSENSSLTLHYPSATQIRSATNNGHSIQLDFEPGDEISFRGERYLLKQIHFHSPSEHTLNGVRFPLEIHLVHKNAANTQFVVLSALGYEGRSSPVLQQFGDGPLPAMGQSVNMAMPFDLSGLFPTALTPRFEYAGSLTTPPCTENVNWIVFETPFVLAEDQVKKLQQQMPVDNYRGVQPLNGREVSLIVH